MPKKTLGWSLALAACLPLSLRAFEFRPVLSVDAQGGYSAFNNGGSGSGLFLGSLLAVPEFKFGSSDYLLPLLFADSTDDNLAISENAFFLDTSTLVFRPVYSHHFHGGWELRARGEAERAFNIQTTSEQVGTGLYDFDEFGGGLEGVKRFGGGAEGAPSVSLALDWLRRGYPNFHNPGTAAYFTAVDNRNYYTRDYQGPSLNLRGEATLFGRLRTRLGYSLAWQRYTDALLIQSDGTPNLGQFREDWYHTLALDTRFAPGAHWRAGAAFTLSYNQSNLAYFDTNVGVYEPGFYDFLATDFKPSLTWLIQGRPEGHRVTFAYDLTFRNYPGRLIRDSDGSYAQGRQADVAHGFYLTGVYAFNPHWALEVGAKALLDFSNQLYAQNINYNYQVWGADMGVRFNL